VRQERLAAVGQLAAGIAHDFNNIMAVIVLYAQLVSQSGSFSERDQERISVIEQQAQNAAHLTEQILDFSRRTILKRQPLDLSRLLQEQVEILRRTLPEHVEIILQQQPGQFMIYADPVRMQQVITNLALNARDALPEGGILRFSLERLLVLPDQSPLLPELAAGEWIQLSVVDNGKGIPPEAMPHLFEPFFTTKGPGQGSGLGLPQVHGIIGQHQGRIDVASEMGVGTMITLYLPAFTDTSLKPEKPATTEFPRGQLETILVVEDSASVREALQVSLEMLNYYVLEAANGREALDLLEQPGIQVALILSDVVMPVMGGIALLRALRQRGDNRPFILLSGHQLDSDLEDLLQEGLDAWLVKPPDLARLAHTVADTLGKKKGHLTPGAR
jgi:two-component system, cell cycle sensor histidine kinase and response regulator CckA